MRKFIALAVCLLTAVLLTACSAPQTPATITPVHTPLPGPVTVPKELAEFENAPALGFNEDAWYADNLLIYHGGGGIDGLDYTNSEESLELTLNRGIRAIEIDFDYTTDNKLVCMHYLGDVDWTAKEYTYEEFMAQKVQGKYTSTDAAYVVNLMREYKDLYVIIDTKNEYLKNVVTDLVNLADDKTVCDRFVVQLYQPEDKAMVEEIYDFPEDNYLFTSYKFGYDPYSLVKLCFEQGIKIITLPEGKYSFTEETMRFLRTKNIYIYEHTINRPDVAQRQLDKGMYGLYTDFLEADSLTFYN